MSTCSQSRPDRGHEQVEEGVGAQLYILHLLEIVERRPVYVRLALWFLHHLAWVKGHTGGSRLTPTVHPCPVQLGRLWVAYVLYEPNTPQEHAQLAHFLFFFGNGRFFWGWLFVWLLINLMMREQTLISGFAARFDCYRIDIREDANTHKAIACKYVSNSVCTVVEECHHGYFCP